MAEIKRELEEGLGLWRAQLLAAQVGISMIVMMTPSGDNDDDGDDNVDDDDNSGDVAG